MDALNFLLAHKPCPMHQPFPAVRPPSDLDIGLPAGSGDEEYMKGEAMRACKIGKSRRNQLQRQSVMVSDTSARYWA